MSSGAAPLLIGLAAAGLLLVLIGIVSAAWRLVERVRMRRRRRPDRSPEGGAASEEWAYRPRAPSEGQVESLSPTAEAHESVAASSGDRQELSAATEEAKREADERRVDAERQHEGLRRESEAEAACITEDARRRAAELLDEAELEAQRIIVAAGQQLAHRENRLDEERADLERRTRLDSVSTVQEAARRAEELLAAAERQCTSLVREAETEAERQAAEITDDATRRVRELLEEAELEAKRIVDAADRERAGLVNELAQERSVLEETRTRLSGFLTDVLEEVEGPPAANEGSAAVRDLDEALAVRTSDGADH